VDDQYVHMSLFLPHLTHTERERERERERKRRINDRAINLTAYLTDPMELGKTRQVSPKQMPKLCSYVASVRRKRFLQ
jgi:hypothetical protein